MDVVGSLTRNLDKAQETIKEVQRSTALLRSTHEALPHRIYGVDVGQKENGVELRKAIQDIKEEFMAKRPATVSVEGTN